MSDKMRMKVFEMIFTERGKLMTINKLMISNNIFKDCNKLNPTGFYVYMCISLYQYEYRLDSFSIYDINDSISLEKESFSRSIKQLIKLGYIKEEKRYGGKSNKIKNYSLVKQDNIDEYTPFQIDFLKTLINLIKENKLSKRHFQVFLFLKYKEEKNFILWKISKLQVGVSLNITKKSLIASLKKIDDDTINYLRQTYNVYFQYIYDFLK